MYNILGSAASEAFLQTQLEDTQASLAAALARIEAFRIREKQLLAENALLRSELNKKAPGSVVVGPPPQPSGSGQPPPGAADKAKAKGASVPAEVLPVQLVVGGKRVTGAVLLTPEYLDFVELRARVRQEEYVTLTTMRPPAAAGAPAAGAPCGPLACLACFGAPAEPPDYFDDVRGESRGESYALNKPAERRGVYQMMWSEGQRGRQFTFEATPSAREQLYTHAERWLGGGPPPDAPGSRPPSASGRQRANGGEAMPAGAPTSSNGDQQEEVTVVPPTFMQPGSPPARLSEPSTLLSETHVSALVGYLPARFRSKDWKLLYGTKVHGISLATLYRNAARAAGGSASLLVLRDSGGYVFGCFATEPWHMAPRFYGTGETFVFQLQPHMVMYPWQHRSKVKNDFFLYSTPDCLAVGGCGRFALWLDGELLEGNSGGCATFGSPCLASAEEFKVMVVEVWQVGGKE